MDEDSAWRYRLCFLDETDSLFYISEKVSKPLPTPISWSLPEPEEDADRQAGVVQRAGQELLCGKQNIMGVKVRGGRGLHTCSRSPLTAQPHPFIPTAFNTAGDPVGHLPARVGSVHTYARSVRVPKMNKQQFNNFGLLARWSLGTCV